MAHYAEIDSGNNILRVCVVSDAVEPTEADGTAWCRAFWGGTWIKTSYNGSIRKNFAGTGFTYDRARDAFIAPRPSGNWVLSEETYRWESA